MTGPAILLATQKPLPLRNSLLVRQSIYYYDVATNQWTPWLGDGVTVRFSTSPTGFTDEGYPSTILGPYVLPLTNDDGTFSLEVTADLLTAALTDLVGQIVYQVVEGSYGTTYYNLTNVQPYLVIDPRAPDR